MASDSLGVKQSWLATIAAVCVFSFAGCASEPAQKIAPKAEAPAQPTPVSPSTIQRQDTKLNIQFDWWKLLRSPQLNTLIGLSFDANDTVESAQQTLLKLRQADISQAGFFQPVVTVGAAANGAGYVLVSQKAVAAEDAKFIGESYFGVRIWQLETGYLPDMLHQQQSSGVSATDAETARLRLEATYRTLADNLIASAIQQASLRAQMSAVRKIIAIEQSLLSLARKNPQGRRGEVEAREQSLLSAMDALHKLEAQFEQVQAALHLLLGIPQGQDLPNSLMLESLNLTTTLPLELPSTLIAHRPDVSAAQSEMLPANNKYQTAVDAALKNVESTLLAIYNDDIALRAANDSTQDGALELKLAQQQFELHQASYQEVLVARQNAQFAALSVAQARARQLADAVVLYHALGAGWWEMNEQLRLEIDSELKNHAQQ